MIGRLLFQLAVSERLRQRWNDLITGAFFGAGLFWIVRALWL